MIKTASLGLILLVLIGFATSKIAITRQGSSQQLLKTDEPTPIQEGVMTAKQREHSSIYKQYAGRRKITDPDAQKREFKIVFKSEPQPVSMQDLACEADSVIIGVIQSKSSQLTEDKNFIFTDYEVIVDEVLKDNLADPINPTTLITVTRPGGVIRLNGKVVHAQDNAFKPFNIDGRYLLFLRHLPTSRSYQAVNSAGSFRIENRKVIQLRKDQLLEMRENEADVESFTSSLRIAISTCKAEKGVDSR